LKSTVEYLRPHSKKPKGRVGHLPGTNRRR
jgi:hypothetical protein